MIGIRSLLTKEFISLSLIILNVALKQTDSLCQAHILPGDFNHMQQILVRSFKIFPAKEMPVVAGSGQE